VTLKEEMSSITRSFVVSRAKRSREINEIKQSLARQIKDGRASADLMSSELHEAIQIDLKSISQYVSLNRDAVSSLMLSYKARRKASTKALKARLVIDRISLSSRVKKILLGFGQDRINVRASILANAASSKVKTSSPTPAAAKPSSPTPAAAKPSSPNSAEIKTKIPIPAAVKSNSSTSAAVKSNSSTSAAVKSNSSTPAAVKTNIPTPAAVKTNSPTPAAVKTNSPTPAAVKTHSPTPAAVKTNSPTPAAVKTNSPTPAAFPFRTNNPKK
jgi:hypothetical protein